jgi:hypothetical protein
MPNTFERTASDHGFVNQRCAAAQLDRSADDVHLHRAWR